MFTFGFSTKCCFTLEAKGSEQKKCLYNYDGENWNVLQIWLHTKLFKSVDHWIKNEVKCIFCLYGTQRFGLWSPTKFGWGPLQISGSNANPKDQQENVAKINKNIKIRIK